jgi:gamma-glutamyl:cysteine ligase YbdK (ATP-grasp superfamily)
VYAAFHRIFDCTGHGWANLQSTHINLPFCGDDEFGVLHAAIRVVLPALAGLAASSPAMDGALTGLLDNRLEVYRGNARRVPSILGAVIPEAVFSERDYREQVLAPIYRDLAPLDPAGILRHEWANARGAIARFTRGAIEIRLLDVQEAPCQDLAVVALVVAAVRALAEERWLSQAELRRYQVEPLAALFRAALRDGDGTLVESADYLRAFGLRGQRLTLRELWQHLRGELLGAGGEHRAALDVLLIEGCLARRIAGAVHAAAADCGGEREALRAVYRRLADCLREGRAFSP